MRSPDPWKDLPKHWQPLRTRPSHMRPWQWASMSACLLTLLTVFGLFFAGRDLMAFKVLGLSVAALVIPALFVKRAERRLSAAYDERLRSKHWLVCPECLYDLTGTDTSVEAACPECGKVYQPKQLPEMWRRIEDRYVAQQKEK